MAQEILNIEYNICRLVVKALNKYGRVKEAAAALGVCTKQVYEYIHRFEIVRQYGEYISHRQLKLIAA